MTPEEWAENEMKKMAPSFSNDAIIRIMKRLTEVLKGRGLTVEGILSTLKELE